MTTTPSHSIPGFGPTPADRARIDADMAAAAAMDLADATGYLAHYGQTLGAMARRYEYPGTVLRGMRRHADRAYAAACQ